MYLALLLVLVMGLSGNKYLKSGFSDIDLANLWVIIHLLVSSDWSDKSRNLSSYERFLEFPMIKSVASF